VSHTFQKIKWNGSEVKLAWTTGNPFGVEFEHTMRSKEAPHPELDERFRAFVPHVLKLLELPESYDEKFRVTGLSINTEEDGRCGLVVTCMKGIADANAPLVINTPHLRERMDEEGVGFLPGEMLDCLADVERAAGLPRWQACAG